MNKRTIKKLITELERRQKATRLAADAEWMATNLRIGAQAKEAGALIALRDELPRYLVVVSGGKSYHLENGELKINGVKIV